MNRIFLISAIGAAMLVAMGASGFKILREKAEQQSQATEVVQRWKQSYEALAASISAWDSSYPDRARYRDVLDLYNSVQLERYRLASDPDSVAVTRSEAVRHNDVSIGLQRVCLASGAANSTTAFAATSDSYESLLEGVRDLAERSDVEIGAIAIKADADGVPTALLTDFCLLLRQGVAA